MNLKQTFVPTAAAAVLTMLISLPLSAHPYTEQAPSASQSASKHTVYAKNLAQKASKSNKTSVKTNKNAAQAPVNKISQKDLDSALEMIDKALVLVKSEAREKAKPGKITNCALDGMTLLIEDKKLKSDFLKQIDVDASPEEANKSLRSQFLKAAARYPQLMKDQMLTMAALKGIMRATDDPYTVYLTPDEYKNLNEQMSGGNFGGIGIVMGLSGTEQDPKNSRVLVINKVMEKGPAARVGLRSNDEITHISGRTTYGMDLMQCSKLLRGEAGTSVKLTIRRPSSGHVFDVSLTREVIHVDSLKSEIIEHDGCKIGYLALGIFGETTNNEMEAALRALDQQGCQAYIIDVRNNSGGYVSAAVDICSKFVKTGSRIVSIVDGANKEQIIYSRPNLHSSKKPLAVLINGNSASASEITAGAIRDLHRGKLIGVKSFGKGSVQKLYPYQFHENKTSAFKITTAHYHTPAGHDIHKAGLNPDIEVKMEDELILEREKDVQLQKALETVKADILPSDNQTADESLNSLSDRTILINSIFDEVPYLEKYSDESGTYNIVKRTVNVEGDKVVDCVVVKAADGQEHTLKFAIIPKFDH
ncbi:MAG: S41 family peptidase [Candidatus Bruticola sp.]